MTLTLKSTARNKEIDVALGRSYLYRWLSRAFRYPDDNLVAVLEQMALTSLEAALDLVMGHASGVGGWGLGVGEEGSLTRDLRDATCLIGSLRATVTEIDLAQLQSDHRRVFGHIESSPCPPYETRYGSHHLFQQTHQLSDIAGFYRAFGLDLSDGANERPDHLAIELEFLHFLCFKEAYALEHHGPEQVELCRDAEAKFLKEHLLPWAPSFAKRLQGAAGGGFYKQLGTLMAAFLSTEAIRWGCSPAEEAALQPIEFLPEGCSFSCGQGGQGQDHLTSDG